MGANYLVGLSAITRKENMQKVFQSSDNLSWTGSYLTILFIVIQKKERQNKLYNQDQKFIKSNKAVNKIEKIATVSSNLPRVLSVTSVRGGVGKTAVVSNMAICLPRQEKKVLIIDADSGLPNIDVIYGLSPQYNLNDFFYKGKPLSDIIVDRPNGVQILPAGSGIQELTLLNSNQKIRLMVKLDQLQEEFDFVLIDTKAGISENVTYFNTAAQEIIIVTTSDLTAITEAYSLMKLLAIRYREMEFNLLVNNVQSEKEALEVYLKLTNVSNIYLDISINYLGSIPYEQRMQDTLRKQNPIVNLYPSSKSSMAFSSLTDSLLEEERESLPKGSLQCFGRNIFN